MQLAMKAIRAGVLPLVLVMLFRLVSVRAIPLSEEDASMCTNVRPCKDSVFSQIQCQVAQLNMSAQGLYNIYLEHQGVPFVDQPDRFCEKDRHFPSFDRTSREKKLISLYKIFVFFNSSLGNITQDQENLSTSREKEELLRQLRNTTNMARGLLSNLTCLLCSRYKVNHINVTYDKRSGSGTFQKKQHGCQVLKSYTEVISNAAYAIGKCTK